MNSSIDNAFTTSNIKTLARNISLVENEAEGCLTLLENLELKPTPIIGITGPPGAGKSTLTDALIEKIIEEGKSVAVLCVDPSSPFSKGALLGDRVRMSKWYTQRQVYIRSLASKGSMGGLHPKIIEITDLLRSFPFHYIIIETVGVGQSEVDIAAMADVTVVTLVPEAGDEIQTMKAGLMEIADIFIVNKADRPSADVFMKNLQGMLASAFSRKEVEIPIKKTVATTKEGVDEAWEAIKKLIDTNKNANKKIGQRARKAYLLIQAQKMNGISIEMLEKEILSSSDENIYRFIQKYTQ